MPDSSINNRIRYLDGLRGLAIMMVIMFHAYARFPELVPYHYEFSNFPPFEYGYLGVELFFLISGYVILMSLEKSKNLIDFFKKRWIRLFPTMLIATILIYTTARFFLERPQGIPKIEDTIPGLTLIEPSFWSRILKLNVSSLDGVFWSLFVEVKFYIILGVFYFIMGSNFSVIALCIVYLIYPFCILLNQNGNAPLFLEKIISITSCQYFGWFTSGAFFYLYKKNTNNRNKLILALLVGLLSSIIIEKVTIGSTITCLFILFIFFSPAKIAIIKKILENKIFIFLGFISYPLYLIHQNILISSILKINKSLPKMPMILLPIIPIFVLILICFMIANYIEPFIKKTMKLNTKTQS